MRVTSRPNLNDYLAFVVIGTVVGAVAVVKIAENSRPVFGYLVASGVALAVVRRGSSLWVAALRPWLEGAVGGFGLLTLCLLGINYALLRGGASDAMTVAGGVEETVEGIAEALPAWTKPESMHWAALVFVAALWTPFAAWARPATLLTGGRKGLKRISQMLAFSLSFSFFSSDPVVTAHTAKARERVTASFVGLRNKNTVVATEYLQLRALGEAVRRLPPRHQATIHAMVRQASELPIARDDDVRRLGHSVAARLGATSPAGSKSSEDAKVSAPDDVVASALMQSLYDERATAQALSQIVDAEQTKALEEIFDSPKSAVIDLAKSGTRPLLLGLAEAFWPDAPEFTVDVLLAVATKGFDRAAEGPIKFLAANGSALISQALDAWPVPSPDRGTVSELAAAAILRETLVGLSITGPTAALQGIEAEEVGWATPVSEPAVSEPAASGPAQAGVLNDVSLVEANRRLPWLARAGVTGALTDVLLFGPATAALLSTDAAASSGDVQDVERVHQLLLIAQGAEQVRGRRLRVHRTVEREPAAREGEDLLERLERTVSEAARDRDLAP